MKIFDTEEQNIIRKITQGSDESRTFINIFYSLYGRHLNDVRIKIDKDNGTLKFLFQIQGSILTEKESECISKYKLEKEKQLSNLLIKYLTLLRYLEKEDFIIFFDEAKPSSSITFGWGAVNMPSCPYTINNQLLIDLLVKYADKKIMLSPSLKKLEKNEFMFDEEIRFREQYRLSWVAFKEQCRLTWYVLIVSIVIGFVSMYIGLYGIYKNNIGQDNQFKTQLIENRKIAESIIEEIKELKNPQTDMACIIGISIIFQIIGTLMLALFSFFGIKITPSGDTFISFKPNTHVTIDNNWLIVARIGLIFLVIGIVLPVFQ